MSLIAKAINFAFKKHEGQKRRGTGLEYVSHPVIVSHLVAKYKSGSKRLEELQIAGLLHDTIEDTDCTYAEIEREFGPLVASLVMELTSDQETIDKVGKNEYLKKKMVKMSKYAFILKLIDRYANITDGPTKKYCKDTLEMMDYLLLEREDITDRQIRIINDIKLECREFIDAKEGGRIWI